MKIQQSYVICVQLKNRQHFVENSDMYSLQDLMDISNDVLLPALAKIHASFAQHIKTDCQVTEHGLKSVWEREDSIYNLNGVRV